VGLDLTFVAKKISLKKNVENIFATAKVFRKNNFGQKISKNRKFRKSKNPVLVRI